jgi:hypothetical protein
VVNPTGSLHYKKYFSPRHNHLAPGNRVAKKKFSFSAIFEGVEGKLICLIFELEFGRQSYRKFAW